MEENTILALFILVSVIGLCYLIVKYNANNKTFDNVSCIPQNKVGLLLGTSPVTPQGEHNYYFDNRIYSTVELYEQGKITQIIASGGDYSRENGCNELTAMRDSLTAHGVPDSVIINYIAPTDLFNIAHEVTDTVFNSFSVQARKTTVVFLAPFYTDLNKGADVVERANQSDYVTVRCSDILKDDFCIIDT